MYYLRAGRVRGRARAKALPDTEDATSVADHDALIV